MQQCNCYNPALKEKERITGVGEGFSHIVQVAVGDPRWGRTD